MPPDEAFEKIMKAADRYARFHQDISDAHDRGTTEDWLEAQRDAEKARWELEQMVHAAIFTLTKGGK